MSDIVGFFQSLPAAPEDKIRAVAPAPLGQSGDVTASTTLFIGTQHEVIEPYVTAVAWLKLVHDWKSAAHARKAFAKLSQEGKALVVVGYRIQYEGAYASAHDGELFSRPIMFVSRPRSLSEFPVATLTRMGLDTYLRLTTSEAAA